MRTARKKHSLRCGSANLDAFQHQTPCRALSVNQRERVRLRSVEEPRSERDPSELGPLGAEVTAESPRITTASTASPHGERVLG